MIFLFILTILASSIQQVSRKEYHRRNHGGSFAFSVGGVFFTMLFFLIMARWQIRFSTEIIIYVVPFSICYTLAYIFTMLAIETGPLSLTSLFISYSLVIPMVYGIAVLRESVKFITVIGIAFLLISLVLIECTGKKSNMRISFKWIIYVAVTFLSNGICTTIQKVFQASYKDTYTNDFMILSLALTLVTLVVAAVIWEKEKFLQNLKRGIGWSAICGIGNGVANRLTMILAITLPASFLYPILSAGGIVFTTAVSVLIYREKLSFFQWIGFMLGIFAIVLLNI